MKRKSYFFGLLGILSACMYQNQSYGPIDLTGTWKLIEILSDPGDGSGQFNKTSIDMTIEVFNDNTFKATRVMCEISGGLYPYQTSGTFDIQAGTLTPDNCRFPKTIYFVIEGNHLILSYLSDEPYRQKFEKIAIINNE